MFFSNTVIWNVCRNANQYRLRHKKVGKLKLFLNARP